MTFVFNLPGHAAASLAPPPAWLAGGRLAGGTNAPSPCSPAAPPTADWCATRCPEGQASGQTPDPPARRRPRLANARSRRRRLLCHLGPCRIAKRKDIMIGADICMS